MPRYTDPTTGKSIFSETPLNEDEISEGLGLATAKEIATSIPPLTPQQELAAPTLTSEQEKGAKQQALNFAWGGWPEAKRQFMGGVTPALEMAGATAGTVLGGGPWGTALGYAAGGRVGKGLEVMTGQSKPETLLEATLNTVKDVGIGLLPYSVEKGIEGVSAIKEAIKAPWTKGAKVEDVYKVIGGQLRKDIAGESGMAGAKQTYSVVHNKGNQLYETAKKLVPTETKVGGNNLYSSIDDILKDPASTDAEKSFANDILARISPAAKSGTRGRMQLSKQNLEDIMGRAEETGQLGIMTRPATVEEAYTTKSILSKATEKKGKVGWRAGQMLDALHQDINETVAKIGKPEITQAFNDAINFWKGKVVPQRKVVQLLGKKSSELLPDLLLKDVNVVKGLRASMPEENFQNLKRGLLTDIATQEENNPVRIANRLRTLLSDNKYTMEAAFNEEELGAIKLAGNPIGLKRYLEEHPKTKWVAKYLGYSLWYGTAGLGGALGLKRVFGW